MAIPSLTRKETEVYESSGKVFWEEGGEDDTTSESVEKLDVDTDQAFMTFRGRTVDASRTDNQSSDPYGKFGLIDFSERIGRRQAAGYAAKGPDFELTSAVKHDKETLQQRYNRLQAEVQLLVGDVEEAKMINSATDESESSAIQLASQVSELQQQLQDMNLENILGQAPGQSAVDAELTRQLKSHIGSIKQTQEKAHVLADSTGHVTYELYYHSEQQKFQQLSKVAELEKRLGRLETLIGNSEGKMSSLLSQETQESEKTVMSVVSSLEEKAALLDLNEIDQIEARLQSVLYHMNQISEQKPAVESAEQQSKVNELFEVVKRWDAIASLLPDLVARLEALQHLHSQAADFSQNITHLDATQQKIKEQLETNSSLLSEVKSSFHTNADAIAANCENLEQRIAALFAKLEKS